MPVFRHRRLILVWIPKTGGTALVDLLRPAEVLGHHPASWYAEQFPREWESFRRIAVIRDPIARLRSCYFFARMVESYWHDAADPHPDLGLCRRFPLRELVLSDELWASTRHAGWQPQTDWIGDPPQVELYPAELMRVLIPRRNVTVVDDRSMGELPARALRRARERYASDVELVGRHGGQCWNGRSIGTDDQATSDHRTPVSTGLT